MNRLARLFPRKQASRGRNAPIFEALEPRVLFSADLSPMAGAMVVPPIQAGASAMQTELAGLSAHAASAQPSLTQSQSTVELVLIDARVSNLTALLDDFSQQAAAGRALNVQVVQTNQDGIDVVGQALRQIGQAGDRVSAVHLIGHGQNAMMLLGDSWIDQASVRLRAGEIAGWSSELAANADILLYGCDFAASIQGQAVLQAIGQLTGAAVAASTDATGAVSRSGNWSLEYQTGTINVALALSRAEQSAWQGELNTYVVSNTSASGAGSLAQAVADANLNPGADLITFNLPGGGPQTINLTATLSITDTVTIDATTEPGFAGAPLIRLDGAGAGAGANGVYLGSGSDGSVVRGLIVTGFSGTGVVVISSGNTIAGNFVGTDGSVALGNTYDGIVLVTGASNNVIGGTTAADRNVVSGNGYNGVAIYDAGTANNVVIGNYLGTDVSGTFAVANVRDGAVIANGATGNTIGGTVAGSRNLISGNGIDGVYIGSGTNQVQGNYIGVNASGSAALGNQRRGIDLESMPAGTLIGGTMAGAGNVISGNASFGINVSGAGVSGTTILGNTIGLNAAGNSAISNGNFGVVVDYGAVNTTIGSGSAGNIISGNTRFTGASAYAGGIYVSANGATIEGNVIGLDASRSAAIGNGNASNPTISAGIVVRQAQGAVTIGSVSVSAGNIIANNAGNGVSLFSTGTIDASILGNVIYGNQLLGIDLGNATSIDGVTANDAADADVGPNGLQNYPVLFSAVSDASTQLTVTGSLNSMANTAFRIELYGNATQDASGFGQAQTFLGTVNVTTDAAGNSAFSETIISAVPVGSFISATATKSDATFTSFTDTSELARDIAVISSVQRTITVDTTSDGVDGDTTSLSTLLANRGADGQISLREAITAANSTANGSGGPDQIQFAIAGAGVHTINVASALPAISDAVVIDGTTDAQFIGTPVIRLDGAGAVVGTNGLYFATGSDGSVVRGLMITDFGGSGVVMTSSGNTIAGNYLGTDGSVALGNAYDGILLYSGASNNLIGGTTAADRNLVSGNGLNGVALFDAGTDNNVVIGNYLGTDASGTVAVANVQSGVVISAGASANSIGGTLVGSRNLISGNAADGIYITGGTNQILGNFIGVNASGSAALSNQHVGVELGGTATGTVIGSPNPDASNVISGNGSFGISVSGTGVSNTLIQGNTIGLNATGTSAIGNGSFGIVVDSAAVNTTIGGTQPFSGNIISGNTRFTSDSAYVGGIYLSADGATIQGNRIGVDTSGAALGNGDTTLPSVSAGIVVRQALGVVSIGSAGAGNVIANNAGNGIVLSGSSAIDAAILANSIYNNQLLAIDLNNDGVTVNDLGDGDVGPNGLQNFPLLTSAVSDGSTQVSIGGLLNSTANSAFRIEFYANATQDPSGFGQARTFVGFVNVTTDAAGNATFTTTISGTVAVGSFISATATRSDASFTNFTDTSELARNVAVVSSVQATIAVDTTSDLIDGDTTSLSTLLANRGSDGQISLREAIIAANNTPNGSGGPDQITFDIAGAGVHTIHVAAGGLPAITDAVLIDGYSQPGTQVNTSAVGSNAVLAIELDGASAGAGVDGLTLNASGVTVRGLIINGFNLRAVVVGAAGGDTIEGNFIGTDASGSTAVGNTYGIELNGPNNRVGDTTPAARNLISGSGGAGIGVFILSAGNTVAGNLIGTDASGQIALGNGVGVSIYNSSGNTIGGGSPGAANVLSGNGFGVVVNGPSATGNSVLRNVIGLSAGGTAALGNTSGGIYLNSASNQIGAPGAGNVISGNLGSGIYLTAGATGSVIETNLIGVDASGIAALGNGGDGISVDAANLRIGGSLAGEANTIANNAAAGVRLSASAGSGNAIIGNSIYANAGLAIDLNNDGVTANDVGDADIGANALQNYPVLSGATPGSASASIAFALNSTANTDFRIEFFANPSADPSGHGEAKRYLGFADVTTDASGNVSTSAVLSTPLAAGELVTASATRTDASFTTFFETSEFAANVTANNAPVLAGATNLTTIVEDTVSNPGTLASALIAGQVSDTDAAALSGIAITATVGTNGNWQYSTNGGASWSAIGAVSNSAALLLAANASSYVRFVPNANYYGTLANGLTFRAWDQISGVVGGIGDTTISGGATAFSIATAQAGITVAPVNDAPQGTSGTITTPEDTAYVFKVGDFGFSDPNDTPPNALLGVTIGALPALGSLTVGGVAVTAGQFIPVTDIVAGALIFTPQANDNGSGYASLSFRVQDNGDTANGGADQDPLARSLTFDVTAVNDAPTDLVRVPALTLIEGAPAGASAGTIMAIDPDDASGFAFSLLDNGAGHFQINPVSGALSVLGANLPSAAAQSSYTIIVHVTDPHGDSIVRSFAIAVVPPFAVPPPPLTVPPPPLTKIDAPVTAPASSDTTSPSPVRPDTDGNGQDTRHRSIVAISDADSVRRRAPLEVSGLKPLLGSVSEHKVQHLGSDQRRGEESMNDSLFVGDKITYKRFDVRSVYDRVKVEPLGNGESALQWLSRNAVRTSPVDEPHWEDQKRDTYHVVLDGVRVGSMATSIGLMFYALRGGGLIAAMLTSLPAWSSIDPLVVLAKDKKSRDNWSVPGMTEFEADERGVRAVIGDDTQASLIPDTISE